MFGTDSAHRIRFHLRHVRLVAASMLVTTLVIDGDVVMAEDTSRSESVAIVIHRDVGIDNLTLGELRRIFLADQLYWPNKSRIVLLIREPEALERRIVLQRIYRMSEPEFKRYWVAKVFKAEVPSGPKVVLSANMARDLVTVIPNSVTFMRYAEVDSQFKIVKVDGKMPDEKGYPLNYSLP